MNVRNKNLKHTPKPKNLVFLKSEKSFISEQYRTIRTNILFSNINGGIKSVLFTSEKPSAGKSTVAANVAIAFAQAGKKTLLIDADLRRPTSHYTFSVSNRSGLTTGIVNDLPLEELIKVTGIENLDVVPSGPIPPNPSELLSSAKMSEFLEMLRSIYDMVIVDSPPILAVTDAQILSGYVDGTIIVTNVRNNNRDYLIEAKQVLKKSGANIMGVVLNNMKMKKESESSYHYYGSDE